MSKLLYIIFSFLFLSTGHTSAQTSQLAQPVSLSSSKSATKIKISESSSGYTTGLKITSAIVSVDTTIRVSPKTAYLSIEINGITGSSLNEILNSNNSFWIVDKSGKEIKLTEKFLKKVNGSMESDVVNYTVKIPFRLKTDSKNSYTVRYFFETKDRKKTIDITATK